MESEEEEEEEDEADVQALVLSPRYWAVSSNCFLDEPTKNFPTELCSYLKQFTQFYTHSQYHFAHINQDHIHLLINTKSKKHERQQDARKCYTALSCVSVSQVSQCMV